MYYPEHDITLFLPGKNEANILVDQTEYLEDLPLSRSKTKYLSSSPYGVAIDIGTTTVVLYFVNMTNGQIRQISSFINPQTMYGADVITRIQYCQENEDGLHILRQSIVEAINNALLKFTFAAKIHPDCIERIVIAGNTTMLHILLGANPVPLALAPFTPVFTSMQNKTGKETGFAINPNAEVITLPCLAAYVGADIIAGLAALKITGKNYLFIDIGTNGEIALRKNNTLYACATAAGPAFEGANITCGMSATTGAIAVFNGHNRYQVIGNAKPTGICGSGILDITAYLLKNNLVDETGLLEKTFFVDDQNQVYVTQQDIREIQLAKSAVYSGIEILMNKARLTFDQIDALFVAGGFGNYINIGSALRIGLLPRELHGKIHPVGNSAGIGALQYLVADRFEEKINNIAEIAQNIELSYEDTFAEAFALHMNFPKN